MGLHITVEYIWYVVVILYSVEGKVCFGVVRSSRIRTVFGGGLGNSVEGRVIRVTRWCAAYPNSPRRAFILSWELLLNITIFFSHV